MAIKKFQGAQLAFASTFGTAATFTSISNASQAVASYASDPAHIVGDIIEVTSGWKRLDKKVVRVDAISGAGPYLVTLEDQDTTSTTLYPAGEGVGSTREVTAWTSFSQLKRDVSVSGGGFTFADATTNDDVREQQVPLIGQAVSITINLFWDPSLSWFAAAKTVNDLGDPVPIRWTLLSGEKLYQNARIGFNSEPVPVDGLLTASIVLTTVGETVVYTS